MPNPVSTYNATTVYYNSRSNIVHHDFNLPNNAKHGADNPAYDIENDSDDSLNDAENGFANSLSDTTKCNDNLLESSKQGTKKLKTHPIRCNTPMEKLIAVKQQRYPQHQQARKQYNERKCFNRKVFGYLGAIAVFGTVTISTVVITRALNGGCHDADKGNSSLALNVKNGTHNLTNNQGQSTSNPNLLTYSIKSNPTEELKISSKPTSQSTVLKETTSNPNLLTYSIKSNPTEELKISSKPASQSTVLKETTSNPNLLTYSIKSNPTEELKISSKPTSQSTVLKETTSNPNLLTYSIKSNPTEELKISSKPASQSTVLKETTSNPNLLTYSIKSNPTEELKISSKPTSQSTVLKETTSPKRVGHSTLSTENTTFHKMFELNEYKRNITRKLNYHLSFLSNCADFKTSPMYNDIQQFYKANINHLFKSLQLIVDNQNLREDLISASPGNADIIETKLGNCYVTATNIFRNDHHELDENAKISDFIEAKNLVSKTTADIEKHVINNGLNAAQEYFRNSNEQENFKTNYSNILHKSFINAVTKSTIGTTLLQKQSQEIVKNINSIPNISASNPGRALKKLVALSYKLINLYTTDIKNNALSYAIDFLSGIPGCSECSDIAYKLNLLEIEDNLYNKAKSKNHCAIYGKTKLFNDEVTTINKLLSGTIPDDGIDYNEILREEDSELCNELSDNPVIQGKNPNLSKFFDAMANIITNRIFSFLNED